MSVFNRPSLKIEGCLARNAHAEARMSRLQSLVFLSLRRVDGGSCKTFPFRRCQSFKIEGCLALNARFEAPTCIVFSLWLSSGFAVSVGEAAKPSLFADVKVSNLKDVLQEMLMLKLPHVSSLVSGFPLASPCLMGEAAKPSLFEG